METRIAKVYGITLIAVGTLLLCIDVVIMSFGSEIIKMQINPAKMIVNYLDNLVALSTTIGSVITSHFFIVLAIASGIAFFFALANILAASREEKNFLPLYITGGLSLLFWLIHAFCIGKYFIMNNWDYHSYIRYYSKKFISVEFLFLSLFCVFSTFVLFLLPSGRARGFRKFLIYGLSSVALLCLADIILFGLLNVVFHRESISVFPFLSFIAVCLVGSGSYLLLATPGVIVALQKIDGTLNLSSFIGPVIYKFDSIADTSKVEKKSQPLAAGSGPVSSDQSVMKAQIEILDKKHGTEEAEGTAEIPATPEAQAVKASPPPEHVKASPPPEHVKASPPPEHVKTSPPPEHVKAATPAAPAIKNVTIITALVIGLFFMLITASLMAWYFTMGPGKMALTVPSPELTDASTPKPTPVIAVTAKPAPRESISSVTAGVGQPSPSPVVSAKIRILPESDIAYTDISESTFRLQIIGLARMGIFDKVTGEFRPDDSISRSLYIRWLVKTNNMFFPTETGNFIKVAQSGDSTFRDVTPDNPDWKWIQGMANAGYIIGYDEIYFKPEKEISREEMMAIRCGLEYNITLKDIERIEKNLTIYKKDLEERFNDASKIERKYVAAYFKDMDSSFIIFRSAFGTTRILLPQKKLTREEAVSTLWTIRGEKGDKVLNR